MTPNSVGSAKTVGGQDGDNQVSSILDMGNAELMRILIFYFSRLAALFGVFRN
jgi:hypothetical protein